VICTSELAKEAIKIELLEEIKPREKNRPDLNGAKAFVTGLQDTNISSGKGFLVISGNFDWTARSTRKRTKEALRVSYLHGEEAAPALQKRFGSWRKPEYRLAAEQEAAEKEAVEMWPGQLERFGVHADARRERRRRR
jgi:hypothetical protein